MFMDMSLRHLPLAVATLATAAVLATPAASVAATSYTTDKAGDVIASGVTATAKKNADIRKMGVGKTSGKVHVRVWVTDVTGGFKGSVLAYGKVGRSNVEFAMWRGETRPVIKVGNKQVCATKATGRYDVKANAITMSVPATCLPAGTWKPTVKASVTKDQRNWAFDYGNAPAVRVR